MTPNSQAVKDVAASHETLIHLFGAYSLVPPTPEPLHRNAIDGRYDGVTREDYVAGAFNFRQRNDGRISELDYPLWSPEGPKPPLFFFFFLSYYREVQTSTRTGTIMHYPL